MKPRSWWLLFAASILFVMTAPIEDGNGATVLGFVLAGILIKTAPFSRRA